MDPTLKRILGLREDEEAEEKSDGKLDQSVVVYLTPQQIGDEKGAHCGACIFFNKSRSECLLTTPSACNADKGVCSAFLGGNSIFKDSGSPLQLLPKTNAGYIEEAPTRCSTCEYWKGKEKEDPEAPVDEEGACEAVSGTIYAGGCCNKWEKC